MDRVEQLSAEIQRRMSDWTVPLVAIDGMDGVGKSFLAERLAPLIGASHINLDDFVEPERGGFLESLRYDELRRAVDQARHRGPVVVEGACVLEVLRRLDCTHGMHIYVKRLLPGRLWPCEDLFSSCPTAETALAKKENEARRFAKLSGDTIDEDSDPLPGLLRELIEYHYAYKPHEVADYVFERA